MSTFIHLYHFEGEHPISELKVGDWFEVFIEILICPPWMTAPLNRDMLTGLACFQRLEFNDAWRTALSFHFYGLDLFPD